MGMKFDKIIRFSLIILVGISLVLSWAIWTRPRQYDTDSVKDKKKISVSLDKEMRDVFLPTSLIYHVDNQSLASHDESTLNILMHEVSKWKIDRLVNDEASFSADTYREKLMVNNQIELVYPDAVTFGLFQEEYQFKLSKYETESFNRIVIQLDTPSTIYFFNDEEHTMYSATISNVDFKAIQTALSENEEDFKKVTPYALTKNFLYLTQEDFSIPRASYLIEEQNIPSFLELLFSDPLAVKHDTVDGYDQYDDGKSVLKVWPQKEMLTFFNPSEQKISENKRSKNDDLLNSFSYFNQLGGWSGSMRYFEYNAEENQISYRRYVEGYPVFSDEKTGSMQITLGDTGLRKLQRVVFNMQVPIPTDKPAKKLPSGVNVMERLNQLGYYNNVIQNIEVGYCWEKNDEGSQQVIDIDPVWYVLLDKGDGTKWYKLDTLEREAQQNGL